MKEIETKIKNSTKGSLHEILVGYYLNNKNFPIIKRPFENLQTEFFYNELIDPLSQQEIKYLHRKAYNTVTKLKKSLNGRHYKISELKNIYWTPAERDVSYITNIVDNNNPSDILLEFNDKFLGLSLKSSCTNHLSNIGNYSIKKFDSLFKTNTSSIVNYYNNQLIEKSIEFGVNPEIYTLQQLRKFEKSNEKLYKTVMQVSTNFCRKMIKKYSTALNNLDQNNRKNAILNLTNVDKTIIPYLIITTNTVKDEFIVTIKNPIKEIKNKIEKTQNVEFSYTQNSTMISVVCDNTQFGKISLKPHRGGYYGLKGNFWMNMK